MSLDNLEELNVNKVATSNFEGFAEYKINWTPNNNTINSRIFPPNSFHLITDNFGTSSVRLFVQEKKKYSILNIIHEIIQILAILLLIIITSELWRKVANMLKD